jgi:ketosteroid isomerase-like protein
MASTNVELARRVVDAFNERDLEAFDALVSDDFEWVTPTASGVEPKTYRGRDGIRMFFEEAKVWEAIESHVNEIRDLGDGALVLGELHWWDRRGGSLEVGGPLSSVLRVEEGKLKRVETYRKASDALAAAGLDE